MSIYRDIHENEVRRLVNAGQAAAGPKASLPQVVLMIHRIGIAMDCSAEMIVDAYLEAAARMNPPAEERDPF